MSTLFRCPIAYGADSLRRVGSRYDLIERLTDAARARDVSLLAFGLGDDELRVILEGDEAQCANVVRVTKAATCRTARTAGDVIMWGSGERVAVTEATLAEQVAFCHRVGPGADPLASPWTSHRDLLGYRQAPFFQPVALAARVDALHVHALAGGGPLPARGRRTVRATLTEVLRIAAAVVGVPPGHRRSFRLFVHLGRAIGWAPVELAKALVLTSRRIRQLSVGDEPLLGAALAHIADARLAVVP
jgi:hypothetical protein